GVAAENEGNDVPNGSRFSAVIEKIERLYMVCNMVSVNRSVSMSPVLSFKLGDGAKNSKNNKNNKNKRKFNGGGDKSANKKSTLVCWKCNKPGHMKRDCRSRKSNDGAGSKGSNDPEKQQDNVLYVPRIRKNLVSEIVLNKCGYKQVLESDKYILSRRGSFVGFGYVCNGMIRLNLNYPLYNASAGMGCRAVVRLTEPKMKNLGEKGIDCIFIGYAKHSKCYRFYVIEPNDYVSVNSIIESRDAIFDEERFTSILRPRGMIQPFSSKITEDEVEGADDVPGPSVPRKTIQSEIDSILHNDTWELTDLPPGCKALGCK
nr:zinc finger, CCHC-type [Tanacetum cinerariifolium]